MKEHKKFMVLVIIHIILILVLVGLMIKLKIQEKNYYCEDCQAKFTTNIGYDKDSEVKSFIYENLTRMYEYYLREECSIRFDSSGGFTGGLVNINITQYE